MTNSSKWVVFINTVEASGCGGGGGGGHKLAHVLVNVAVECGDEGVGGMHGVGKEGLWGSGNGKLESHHGAKDVGWGDVDGGVGEGCTVECVMQHGGGADEGGGEPLHNDLNHVIPEVDADDAAEGEVGVGIGNGGVDGVRVGSDSELLEVLRGSAHTTKELGRWRRGMEGIGGEGEVELGRHHKESITGRVLVVGLPRRPQLEVLVELFVHSSCMAGGGSQVFCLLEVVASHVEVVIPHMVLRTLLGGQETMVCHKQVVRDPEITWVGGGVEEDGEVLDVHEGPR